MFPDRSPSHSFSVDQLRLSDKSVDNSGHVVRAGAMTQRRCWPRHPPRLKVRAEDSSSRSGPAGFCQSCQKRKQTEKKTDRKLDRCLKAFLGRFGMQRKSRNAISKVHCDAVGTVTDERHRVFNISSQCASTKSSLTLLHL